MMHHQMLQEVISLPDYEAPNFRNPDSLSYMAQWDYGEYHTAPIPRREQGSTVGRAVENEEYLLLRCPDGSMVLYRKLKGDDTYDLHLRSNHKAPFTYAKRGKEYEELTK